MNEGPTVKEMCETIATAGVIKKHNGEAYTAEEIFNYSPSGELSMVFLWYSMVQALNKVDASIEALLEINPLRRQTK